MRAVSGRRDSWPVQHWARGARVALAVALLSGCADAAFGPRRIETTIFFTRDDGTYANYTMAPDGSRLHTLTAAGATELQPVVSPDGTMIAFSAFSGGRLQIVVIASSGSASSRHVVTRHVGGAAFPSWSPDSKRIFFQGVRDLGVWSTDIAGTSEVRITPEGRDYQTPALSPDGTRIAFATARHFSLTQQVYELYVMNADGTNEQRLTWGDDAIEGMNAFPAWSPDGESVAFLRTIGGSVTHVFVIGARGGGLHQVLSGRDGESGVAWSPDGRMLAFTRFVNGRADLFIARADDGGAVTNLTRSATVNESYPSWGRVR